MALNGIVVPSDNGILAESAKKCIENLGRLSNQAMKDADDTILDIMLKKFY
nr:hypothetical protein [Desulfurella sp.]